MRNAQPFLPLLSLGVVFAAGACAAGLDGTGPSSSGGDTDAGALLPTGDDANDDGEAASFSAAPPTWDASIGTGALDASVLPPVFDSGGDRGSRDAAAEASCTQPLGPGVLVIDEMMIESVAGTGDYGQWIEIASTASCAVDLSGLHAECPVGSKVRTLDVAQDLWVPPGGTFIIADSTDPATNHYLPGMVLAWDGDPGSVLRKSGGTVSLMASGTLVDSVTWPKLAVVVGASVAFPADCPASDLDDWTTWQTSTACWFPGFYGTPNAPNTDVSCP